MWKAILLFFVCVQLYAEIYEIRQIKELESYLQEDALVIYDLDHTLIHLVQSFGNDHWFSHQCKEHQKRGLSQGEALQKTLFEWESIQRLSEVKLVEIEAREQIARLQADGKKVMALTTRGLGMIDRTLHQLKEVGVDFTKSAPADYDVYVLNPWGTLYRKGVYFTEASHKGRGLFKLLDEIGYYPKAILFINDKEDHLQEVETLCLEKGVAFTGLRYGFLDEEVANLDHEIVLVQYNHFGRILPDTDAKKIAEK